MSNNGFTVLIKHMSVEKIYKIHLKPLIVFNCKFMVDQSKMFFVFWDLNFSIKVYGEPLEEVTSFKHFGVNLSVDAMQKSVHGSPQQQQQQRCPDRKWNGRATSASKPSSSTTNRESITILLCGCESWTWKRVQAFKKKCPINLPRFSYRERKINVGHVYGGRSKAFWINRSLPSPVLNVGR